jgi:CRP-like cAMP-binding protein
VTTHIHLFRRDANPVVITAGQTIFRDGDGGNTMFGVIDGEIAIVKGGVLIEKIGPGGILGEMALIDEAPRSADAIAMTDCSLSLIDRPRFEFLVGTHPTFALQVMQVMAERLRVTDERLRAATTPALHQEG